MSSAKSATAPVFPFLIVVSAPSGAGKTTLCTRLLQEFPDQIQLSISSTTRLPRGTEQEGVEYFFLSQSEFDRKMKRGEFAEWAEVHGNRYGTSRAFLEDAFQRGKCVLLDIDVQGAKSLQKAYADRSLLFFISPPSLEELEFRLRARGTDTEESIRMRMANSRREMEHLESFDHVIVNDDFDRAYLALKTQVQRHLRQEDSRPNG